MIGINEGLGPQLLEGMGTVSGRATPFALDIYSSPILELTQSYSNIELIPARPGYFPLFALPANIRNWLVQGVTGVQTTPAVVTAGSDPARLNFIFGNEPANVDVNGMIAQGFPNAALGSANVTARLAMKRFPGQPTYLNITSPAVGTGGFSCQAKLIVPIFWIPFGDV